jgi:alkylhydroperoxidase family enzyme/alkyl hydroperoxide reductase subunit AhpC
MIRSIPCGVLAALLIPAAVRADDPVRKPVVLPPLDPTRYADEKTAAATAADIEKRYEGKTQPEAVKMLVSILRGSKMTAGDGWFGPAQSRFSWAWLAEKHKLDPKAKGIARETFLGPNELFAVLDRDGDGTITAGDLDWADSNPYVQQMTTVGRFFRRMDADGDAKLTRDELDALFKRAAKGKDHVTPEDLRAALIPPANPGGFTPGDGPTVPVLVKGLYANEIGSIQEGPSVGDPAPDFALKTTDGKRTVRLAEMLGEKPVVLVFGNFTCGPFRTSFPEADALHERYKGKAHFVMVYVREAHPDDGWKMATNAKAGVAVKQPTTTAERAEVCEQFRKKMKPGMTVLVDEIDDRAGNAYSGMPARFYVIDPKGKVAFKSGRGPFGFKPGEMEQALVMALLESPPPPKEEKGAWDRLPAPELPPLPAWATALSASLPKTTARMLELDYLHRAENPLGNVLAAKVRLAAAGELGSEYGLKTAWADLRRFGVSDQDINGLILPNPLGPDEPGLAFARKLTREGHAITDAEFAEVLKLFGPEKMTALVHTVAYANFHNRVVLGLGVTPRADPPVQVSFDAAKVAAVVSPPRPPWDDVKTATHNGLRLRPEWSEGGYDLMAARQEAQKDRKHRMPLPDESRFAGLTGRDLEQAKKIQWNTISAAYQPKMTRAWFACLNEFYAESKVNRVFTNSMFWVVTRTNDCFY